MNPNVDKFRDAVTDLRIVDEILRDSDKLSLAEGLIKLVLNRVVADITRFESNFADYIDEERKSAYDRGVMNGIDDYKASNQFSVTNVDLLNKQLEHMRRKVLDTPEAYAKFDVNEVYEMIQGHKINAIKMVRVRLGLGLKEAKDMVDEWMG